MQVLSDLLRRTFYVCDYYAFHNVANDSFVVVLQTHLYDTHLNRLNLCTVENLLQSLNGKKFGLEVRGVMG